MPRPTPVHRRTQALCESYQWKDWSGFYAVVRYGDSHEPEYVALRHACGLIDVSPLFKFRVQGPDATRFLDRLLTRNVARCEVGQVQYTTWCDSAGKVLDDGTVAHLGDGDWRVTAAHPMLRWFGLNALGLDVRIEDESERVAALSLQGPTSRDVLARTVTGCDVAGLGFFRLAVGHVGAVPVMVSRTGYTGDLGYEVWMDAADAVTVWDAVAEVGRDHGLAPVGLAAMDMTRIEAGFILADVDYTSVRFALTSSQTSTPDELGLAWLVSLKKGPFVGRAAIERERAAGGPVKRLVGLEVDYTELEALYERARLPVHMPVAAWRGCVPVFQGAYQVGYATSGTWSPTLKKNLALATLDRAAAAPGTTLRVETLVDHVRHRVGARVVDTPFYDPPHKRA